MDTIDLMDLLDGSVWEPRTPVRENLLPDGGPAILKPPTPH